MHCRFFNVTALAVVLLLGGLVPEARADFRGVIASGETLTATLPLGDTHDYSFSVQAWDRVVIKSTNHNTVPQGMTIQILDAGYALVAENSGCEPLEFTFEWPLPPGSYFVRTSNGCDPGYAGDYSISLLNLDQGPLTSVGDPDGGPLASAQTVTGTMTLSDLDAYQFHGTAGERLRIKAAVSGTTGIPGITVFGPDRDRFDYCDPRGRLPDTGLWATGLYTLILKDCGSAPWNYDLTLQLIPGAYSHADDLDGGLLSVPADITGTIGSSSDLDALNFYAVAGELMTLNVRNISGTLDAAFTLHYPDGTLDSVNCYWGVYGCDVPTTQAGLYTVIVEDYEKGNRYGNAGTYGLTLTSTLQPPPHPGLYGPQPAVGQGIDNAFDPSYLSWAPVAAATSYQVSFGEGVVTALEDLGAVTTPSIQLPYQQLPAGGSSYWRVTAATPTGDIEGPVWWFNLDCDPAVSVSPSSHDFGDVLNGQTSAPQEFTITNNGTCFHDPRIASVPTGFTVLSDDCSTQPAGGHLAPAESCTISVAFSPVDLASYAGGIVLAGFLPGSHSGVIDLLGVGVSPDLWVTSVSNPPPMAVDGSFDVTDTTFNGGNRPAGTSVTSYRLSLDQTITAADPLLVGTRNIPALAAAASSTGTVTAVTIPSDLPSGTYYLGACADHDGTVVENDETNNCLASSSTMQVNRDLTVAEVSDPAQPDASGQFSFTETTRNIGTMNILNAQVSYRFSQDLRITRMDPWCPESRSIPLLTPNPDPGHFSTATVTLSVPPYTPRGSYYVAACVDGENLIAESNESNNCRFSKTTIKVEPDLVVLSVSAPPVSVYAGAQFAVTDEVWNKGFTVTEPSTTRYRLSLDTTITATDPLLDGVRALPPINVGGIATYTTIVRVPTTVPPGTFYLAACADDLEKVSEIDELNNCTVSASPIEVGKGELWISSMGNPPATGYGGFSWTQSDTTRNDGEVATGATTTTFRLSVNDTYEYTDPLLDGNRIVPELGWLGGESAGFTEVTIPASTAPGLYYLLACADGLNRVPETDETNNCRASTTMIQINLPDLTVTALGNPPATALVGSSFAVTDTTRNNSSSWPVVASTTRYRLTTGTTVGASDPVLTGTRAVPALAASASSSGGATVTIPATLTPATYYLAACADDTNAIMESNDNNNCRVNTTRTMVVSAAPSEPKPDLALTSISTDAPDTGAHGTSFNVSYRADNLGAAASLEYARVEFRLTADTTVSAADPLLVGTRSIGPLQPGQFQTATDTATIHFTLSSVAAGTYYVAACVDSEKVVAESSETNNCLVDINLNHRITVLKGDLRVSALGNPPVDIEVGETFDVTDTTVNSGTWTAWPSATRYRLSLDNVITSSDYLLTGSRSVPTLDVGNSSTGTLAVTVPTTVPQGTYYLAACADDLKDVPESDETNNCFVAADTVDILSPDLVVTSVSDPPVSGYAGTTFNVTDTTTNDGLTAAGPSLTCYRLTLDQVVDSKEDILLSGSRTVTALEYPFGNPAASSTGTTTVEVPVSTPAGLYYLAACADETSLVKESVETNNCRVSAGRILIYQPDLANTVIPVPDPPVTVAYVGTTFNVTDRIQNLGTVPAGKSTTRYRFSLDTTITAQDPLLTGSRAVPALAPQGDPGGGDVSTGTATVVVPALVAAGTYYLAACADDTSTVSESNETNNCSVSTSTIELRKPDLAVTVLSEPPAGPLSVGETFTVTDTTSNAGSSDAAATITRYRLSTDATIASSDPLLTGERAVPVLAGGASSASPPVTLTIPTATIFQGYYYLAACADDAKDVSESDETNNCKASLNQVYIGNPDLVVSSIANPPGNANAGEVISVSCTTQNVGSTAAVSSSTRFRLSTDRTITGSDTLLTGTIAIPPLNPAASQNSAADLTIPLTVAEGYYYLGACADDEKALAESDEKNNCTASDDRVYVAKPNLVVGSVSNPPATGWPGMDFVVTDSTMNIGDAPAPESTNRYRLSLDTTITTSDLLLTGTQTVPALTASGTPGDAVNDISTTLSIPATVSAGTYYLAACADDLKVVTENTETDNCLVSSTPMDLMRADLSVKNISHQPIVLLNVDFTVTETTFNLEPVPTGYASTTRYRLSPDSNVDGDDLLITTGTRSVPILAAAGDPGGADASTGVTTVKIQASVAPGTYYLGVCADHSNAVPESNETNNCVASTTTITVQ